MTAITAAKLVPLVFASHGGTLRHDDVVVPVSRTFFAGRSVEIDALLIAGAPRETDARILLLEAFRHFKGIGVLPRGSDLLTAVGLSSDEPSVLVDPDPARLIAALIEQLEQHRVWDRVLTG